MSKDLNDVKLIGNLTADPELKMTASGKPVCKICLAVNDDFGEKKKVNFIEIITWNKLAEICNQYLKKGNKICVSGKIDQQRWEKDTVKHNKIIIQANEIHFLTPKITENTNKSEPPKFDNPWGDSPESPVDNISGDDIPF